MFIYKDPTFLSNGILVGKNGFYNDLLADCVNMLDGVFIYLTN